MARVGIFGPVAVAVAWFDSTTQPIGIFDASLMEAPAAPPPPVTSTPAPRKWSVGSMRVIATGRVL